MTITEATILQDPPFWRHDGWMMGGHWVWWIFWLVVAVVLVWALVRALSTDGSRSSGGGGAPGGGTADPEEILRRRFARGEISKEEFRERLAALRDSQ